MAKKKIRTFHTDLSPRAVVSYNGYAHECEDGNITTDDPDFQDFLEANTNFIEVVESDLPETNTEAQS